MSLSDLRPLADQARSVGRGLGAFNVVFLEHAEAQVAGAEAAGLPVVLQVSQNAVRFHRGRLAPLGAAVLRLAEAATVPVVVHLDHADDPALCREAVDLGFTSVMYDGSRLDVAANAAATAQVAAYAHAAGVSVEAELGEVGGKDGAHAPGVRTDPAEARRFVEATGVDLLAVAVGSSHAMVTREARLDLDLIARLRAQLDVPLVLHGSSGVSDAGMEAAIRAGITKVNVATHLNVGYTARLRQALAADPDVVDPRRYTAPATATIEAEVERLLRLYAGDASAGAR